MIWAMPKQPRVCCVQPCAMIHAASTGPDLALRLQAQTLVKRDRAAWRYWWSACARSVMHFLAALWPPSQSLPPK